ncbi:prickle planar cell polarity protein 3 isoform X2 [Protopterus annectens]|uniref:prickle planar cell polarity protein 3 isoform X2 n=1 Tax=Protopterus annectens TaxID=7888 RepID=UPI001CF9FC19|nr:prickle planar cell polarity protein 3 isoform X2 [Protopterus annectens]
MFIRGSRRRRSNRSLSEAEDPDRGQPCNSCGEQCPGFLVHGWRKICLHCKCPREEHAVNAMPGDLEKMMCKLVSDFQRHSISDDDSGCASEEYAWVPPGIKPEQVYQYFSCIPEDRVPYVNSPGERYRIKQLLHQLPPHDSEAQYCNSLDEDEKKELRLFSQQRKRENLGRGTVRLYPLTMIGAVCEQCGKQIRGGDIAVFASRAGHGVSWHPQCFVCAVCSELLVDLIYFYQDRKIYCGRHHAEQLKPRCQACDEIIFADECTEAEGRHWHMKHFCCFECETALGGQRYIMKESRPYCCSCYESLHAEYCDTCGEHIGIDQGQMTYEGQHWHASDKCFSCAHCRKPLLGKPFLPKQGQIFCSRSCSLGEDPNGSDSCDSAFQTRTRESRRSGRQRKMSITKDCRPLAVCRSTPFSGNLPSVPSPPSLPEGNNDPMSRNQHFRKDTVQGLQQEGSSEVSSGQVSPQGEPPWADHSINRTKAPDNHIHERPKSVSCQSPVEFLNGSAFRSDCFRQKEETSELSDSGSQRSSRGGSFRRWEADISTRSLKMSEPIGKLAYGKEVHPPQYASRGTSTSFDKSDQINKGTDSEDSIKFRKPQRYSMPDLDKKFVSDLEVNSSSSEANLSVKPKKKESIPTSRSEKPLDITDRRSCYVQSQARVSFREPLSSTIQMESITAENENALPGMPLAEDQTLENISGEGGRAGRHRSYRRRRSQTSRRAHSDNALHLATEYRSHSRDRPSLYSKEEFEKMMAAQEGATEYSNRALNKTGTAQCPPSTVDLHVRNRIGDPYHGLYCTDDDWCSTCSSSSDSEEEGYFLGEPIPLPPYLQSSTSRDPRTLSSPTLQSKGMRKVHRKGSRRDKNCIVS